MMDLSNLTKLKGKRRKAKRIGKGIGSGKGGHTSSRGQKGQKSRSGHNIPVGFEGGQVPMYKKIPHTGGFRNSHDLDIVGINVRRLNVFKEGETITPQILFDQGYISYLPEHGVKVLGDGEVSKKLTLEGFLYSAAAKAKIEKLGGQAN